MEVYKYPVFTEDVAQIIESTFQEVVFSSSLFNRDFKTAELFKDNFSLLKNTEDNLPYLYFKLSQVYDFVQSNTGNYNHSLGIIMYKCVICAIEDIESDTETKFHMDNPSKMHLNNGATHIDTLNISQSMIDNCSIRKSNNGYRLEGRLRLNDFVKKNRDFLGSVKPIYDEKKVAKAKANQKEITLPIKPKKSYYNHEALYFIPLIDEEFDKYYTDLGFSPKDLSSTPETHKNFNTYVQHIEKIFTNKGVNI